MPHTRLDRLTYTIYGATETELVATARRYLTAHVTDVEQWNLHIDAEQGGAPANEWKATQLIGTVVATRRPTPAAKTVTT